MSENYWKKQMKNRNQKLIKYITIEKLKLDNVDADVSTYFISEAAIPAV